MRVPRTGYYFGAVPVTKNRESSPSRKPKPLAASVWFEVSALSLLRAALGFVSLALAASD